MNKGSLICAFALVAITLIAGNANAQTVLASHYGHQDGFHGQQMANGDYFDKNNPQMAAHWTLPMCTQVRLQNPDNQRELTVVITDRGPHPRLNRDFDLSYAAARKLEFFDSGLANLNVIEMTPPKPGWRWGRPCDNYVG